MEDVNGPTIRRDGPWVAVDTGLLRNRKLRELRPAARLLYVAALLHCGDEETDGHVLDSALPALRLEAGARRADELELERVGLWTRNGAGYLIPHFLSWNPSRNRRQELRAQNAERQRQWRERRKGNALRNGASHAVTNGTERERKKERSSRAPAGACPDCGEKPGFGHLETCPRMPRTVDLDELEHHTVEKTPDPAPAHGIPPGGSRTPEALAELLRDA